MNTDDAFLAAIIREPAEDVHRLVYADWLEERGGPERAEFIRLQCRIAELEHGCLSGGCVRRRGGGQHHNGPCAVDREREQLPDGRSRQAFLRRREREIFENASPDQDKWAGPAHLLMTPGKEWTNYLPWFRRGFVTEVACTLADWCGTKCPLEFCERGYWRHSGDPNTYRTQCSTCRGTGRTPAHGPALVRAAPLERGTLSDRRPLHFSGGVIPGHIAGWRWFAAGIRPRFPNVPEAACLPDDVFDLLPKEGRSAQWLTLRPGGDTGPAPEWDAEARAVDAASVALLAWAQPRP